MDYGELSSSLRNLISDSERHCKCTGVHCQAFFRQPENFLFPTPKGHIPCGPLWGPLGRLPPTSPKGAERGAFLGRVRTLFTSPRDTKCQPVPAFKTEKKGDVLWGVLFRKSAQKGCPQYGYQAGMALRITEGHKPIMAPGHMPGPRPRAKRVCAIYRPPAAPGRVANRLLPQGGKADLSPWLRPGTTLQIWGVPSRPRAGIYWAQF
jgi:hypothetical protein